MSEATRDVTIAGHLNDKLPVVAHVAVHGSPNQIALLAFYRSWSTFTLAMTTDDLVALRDAITEVVDEAGVLA